MNAIDTSVNFIDAVTIKAIEMEDLLEEWDNDIAESMLSIDTGENEKQSEWPELPSLPLEKIYSFLSRADQINLSQVCRKWSEGYGSPSVWKTFRFYLTDSELSMDTCPEIKFSRKYSSMFRHVEIVCRRINLQLIDTSWRQLKVFLDILTTNSQLLTIKFRNLGNYLRQLDTPIYDDIFRAIASLLGSQHLLKRLEFHECFFRFQEGVELLKDITENSRESLTHLVLRGFIHEDPMDHEQDSNVAQSLPTFVSQRFPRLTTFETDYSLIFDNMFARQSAAVDALKNCQMRSLSKIILHCDGFRQSHFQGLTSVAWSFLKQLCPDLQVELYFLPGSQSRREMEFFILPEMPITLLDYRLDRLHGSSIIEIDTLFNHLLACKVNDHLVSLYLVWMMPIHDLASTFIPFFQACSKLKCLQLFTVFPANGIDLLMRSWLENRPESLEEVLISISNVRNEDEYMSLMTLADEYVPLLQVLGLNAFLILDHGWR
ncbi:hypothetical protein HNY73_013928 [Argiope bruennichi]|uniref:F-box domain-containing protein n=1 Tax=Argiope bruennichi TaxID=94029 RepID=A0A8T0ENH5_ARGBR|nr:hypothetical protein HNY73_013928 [Argiope bruennichi]